jgi:hypothetical protein
MNLLAVFCILVTCCTGSLAVDKQDQQLIIDIEVKFDADLKYYQNRPVKAKKRFSSLLSYLSSPRAIKRARYVKARKNKSMDKARDVIARKMINIMKSSGSHSIPDNDLQKRANSIMIKVSTSFNIALVPYGCTGESSSARKAQSHVAR